MGCEGKNPTSDSGCTYDPCTYESSLSGYEWEGAAYQKGGVALLAQLRSGHYRRLATYRKIVNEGLSLACLPARTAARAQKI